MAICDIAKMTISELTRRDIIDYIICAKIRWCGRLEEIEFLNRLFDLQHMPSHDGRFKNAEADIFQHRVTTSTGTTTGYSVTAASI